MRWRKKHAPRAGEVASRRTSQRTPGKLFAVPRHRLAEGGARGGSEQRLCQTSFSIENNELCADLGRSRGVADCQVVTVARRLRHRQTALGMLLELVAE